VLKKIFIFGSMFLMLSIGAKPTNAAVMHNIKQGESLYTIASNNHMSVTELKQANGLQNDRIYAGHKLAIPGDSVNTTTPVNGRDIDLLARLITAEANNEPYQGKVAVASVILNRMSDKKFPETVAGNIFKPNEFESVSNGLIWRRRPTDDAYKAAQAALKGWDPTYGSKFFFNPAKVHGPSWVWSRRIVERIGNHVFGV
jgi:N-acetylmuramoyl-L-alanine amidase